MSAQNRLRTVSLSFPSDLVREVRARASVERQSRETRKRRAGSPRRKKRDLSFVAPLPSRAFSHARDHLRVSGVLLDGLRNKRDCYGVNIA